MTNLLACQNCHALVEETEQYCPVCNASRFSDDWAGYLIVAHPERRGSSVLGVPSWFACLRVAVHRETRLRFHRSGGFGGIVWTRRRPPIVISLYSGGVSWH